MTAQPPRTLSLKRAQFVRHYVIDLNLTRAAAAVGYRNPEVMGKRIRALPLVRAAIDEALKARVERIAVTEDRVIAELAKIGFANMADYVQLQDGRPVVDLERVTRDQAAAIVEMTIDQVDGVPRIKIKLADKRAALVDLGKHLGMFRERVEISGPDGGAVQIEAVRERLTERIAKLGWSGDTIEGEPGGDP